MKPLAKTELTALQTRFCEYENIEIKRITFSSATSITLTLNTQDKQRDFDWIALTLECNGITDAKLDRLENATTLSLFYDGAFVLCDEACTTLRCAKDTRSYLVCSSMKIQEDAFIA